MELQNLGFIARVQCAEVVCVCVCVCVCVFVCVCVWGYKHFCSDRYGVL